MSAWSFSSSQYVRTAVKNMEEYLKSDTSWSWKLLAKAEMLIWASYRPELDVSPELNNHDASYYQSLIGVIWWIVELGGVDMPSTLTAIISPCSTM